MSNNVKIFNGEKFITCVECERDVHLYSMWASDCDCGAVYNGFGQQLASRDQWENELDETF